MQILSITLKNIKSHRDLHLDFVNGINVLSGPNGAGKSTIFEAVGYGLFGVDAKDFVTNVDRFLSIGKKKGMITVTFRTDNGESYRVSRSVGAGSKWLLAAQFGDDFEVEEHSGTHETESRIKELLGLEGTRSLADQFKLVIGPFQHDFLGPFILKGKKRQEAFDEILGIDGWRKTYKGTANLISAVNNKIELLDTKIEGKKEQLAQLPKKKRLAKKMEQTVRNLKKGLKDTEKKRKKKEKELELLDSQEKKINDKLAGLRRLEDRITDGREKITNQEKRVAEAEKANGLLEKTAAAKLAFESAEKEIAGLRKQEQQRRQLEKETAEQEKKCSKLSVKLKHEQEEIIKTTRELKDDQQKLQTTYQGLKDDKKMGVLIGRLPDIKKQLEEQCSFRDSLDGRREGLLEGKEKLSEGLCPFFMETCQNVAGKEVQDVFSKGIDHLNKQKRELDDRIDKLRVKLKQAEKAQVEQNNVQTRREEIEKQLDKLEGRKGQIDHRQKKRGDIQKQLEKEKIILAGMSKEMGHHKGLEQQINRLENKRKKHQQKRDTYLANLKDGKDLQNRVDELKKMKSLMTVLLGKLESGRKENKDLQKNYSSSLHGEVRLKKEQMVAELATLHEKHDNLEREQATLSREIEKLEALGKEVEEKVGARKKLETKKSLVTFLRNRIFNNVSAQLSERFRREISLRADRIYRTIAETDEELGWGENYQILLRDMENGKLRERNDDQLSGGQIMSSVVSLRLALLQTIGARIAFFDEPTSNLDSTRRENMARAFRAIDVGREELSAHWYDQLFLISHDVAFTEVTDQIISLE